MIVDVHGHITPPDLLERLPMPAALGDIDGMIEQKERLGIELSIVGSPVGVGTMVPVEGLDPFSQPLSALQRFHDWLGRTVADHLDRLRAYAWTNPFGDEAMLDQTAATVRQDEFVGLIVNTSVHGEYLDSPRADDFFSMAAELDVPILLHPPAEPAGAAGLTDTRLVEQLGRVLDVTAGLATLAFGARLEQYPGLKVVGAMAGGAISLLAGRLEAAAHSPALGATAPRVAEHPGVALRSCYVDTATPSLENLEANLRVFGVERMLFGSDFPPATRPLADSIALVDRLAVSEEDKRRIFSENAKRLFRLHDGESTSASGSASPTTLGATREIGGS